MSRLYTPIEVQEHANVTHRQLQYWRISVPALHTGVDGSGKRCFYTWRQLCLVRTIGRIAFVGGGSFTIPRLFDLIDRESTKTLANGALTIRFNNEISLVLEAAPITKTQITLEPDVDQTLIMA